MGRDNAMIRSKSGALAAAAVLAVVLSGAGANAADMTCTKDAPNPYTLNAGWAKMPEGRKLGSTSALGIGADGHVWAAERCGANTCVGSTLAPVMQFDSTGKVISNWGSGLFAQPHGITVNQDGSLWITDDQSADGKGQQAIKFSKGGKVLMALGKAGMAGKAADQFDQPTSVAVAKNGDIFVSEGHAPSNGNSRIDKFDKTGKLIKSWGTPGAGPDQMLGPHALAFDSKGRLFVADRNNSRVLIFDQGGKLLDTWKQFGMPQGMFIDAKDILYVSDTGSPVASGCRGIRVGSAKDGKVTAFIPDPSTAEGGSGAEGLVADGKGNIYGATVASRELLHWTK